MQPVINQTLFQQWAEGYPVDACLAVVTTSDEGFVPVYVEGNNRFPLGINTLLHRAMDILICRRRQKNGPLEDDKEHLASVESHGCFGDNQNMNVLEIGWWKSAYIRVREAGDRGSHNLVWAVSLEDMDTLCIRYLQERGILERE